MIGTSSIGIKEVLAMPGNTLLKTTGISPYCAKFPTHEDVGIVLKVKVIHTSKKT